MAEGNPVYEKTTCFIEPEELDVLEQTREHLICYCPNCPEKRNKPDRKGKLHWHMNKEVGFCFLCNTTFIRKDEEQEDVLNPAYVSKKIPPSIQASMESFITKRVPESESLSVSSVEFDFQPIDMEILRYLRARNPLLIYLVEYLDIRGWYGRRKGVVFPFYYLNRVCIFQIRYLQAKGDQIKYYTSPCEHKVPFSPKRIFNDFRLQDDQKTLTLCEGIFDAIALQLLGFPNPIALLGKSTTNFHLHLIRKLTPEHIIFAMDDKEINESLEKISRELPTVAGTDSIAFENMDPEEYLMYTLMDNKETYLQNLSDWIGEIKNDSRTQYNIS